MLFAVIWGTLFMRWQYMICPVRDLGVNAWSDIRCDPNPIFIWREWEVWVPLRVFLSGLVRLRPPLILAPVTEFRPPPARAKHHKNSVYALSLPRACHGRFLVPCRSIWWLLRLRIQTCLQHQGFRAQHSWTWGNDRSDGLPVCLIFPAPCFSFR